MIVLRLGTLGLLPLLLLPVLAQAQPPPITAPVPLPTEIEEEEAEAPASLRIGVTGFGSIGTYAMKEFNKRIEEATARVRDEWGVPEIRLDPIDRGVGYGAGILLFWRNAVMLAADYERVLGKSDVGGRLGSSDFEVPTNAFLVTLGYSIYATNVVRFGFAAGLGRYESDATVQFDQYQETVEKVTLAGNAIGQHYVAYLDAPLLGHFNFFTMIGYRRARITGIEATLDLLAPPSNEPNWVPPYDTEDGSTTLDWSGFMGRGAMVYYF